MCSQIGQRQISEEQRAKGNEEGRSNKAKEQKYLSIEVNPHQTLSLAVCSIQSRERYRKIKAKREKSEERVSLSMQNLELSKRTDIKRKRKNKRKQKVICLNVCGNVQGSLVHKNLSKVGNIPFNAEMTYYS